MPWDGLVDSLDKSELAGSETSISHGSSELFAILDIGIFKISCGTLLKYELSSSKCSQESGVVGPFDGQGNGW